MGYILQNYNKIIRYTYTILLFQKRHNTLVINNKTTYIFYHKEYNTSL